MASIARDSAPQGSFVLDHFRATAPGRLEVEGKWDGLEDVNVDECALVLHVDDRVERVEPDSVRRTARSWQAVFLWDGDTAVVHQALLEVGGELVVELGAQPSARRWLGRVARPVLPIAEQRPDAETEPPRDDVIALHAELVGVRDQLANAISELETAREAERRARDDAERERTRRQNDSVRLHEALDRLKHVAGTELRRERDQLEAKAAEIDNLELALKDVRSELAGARRQVASAVQAREQFTSDSRAQVEAAQAEVAAVRAELEQLQERHSRLSVLLSDARAEAQRLADVESAHAKASAALSEAQRAAQASGEEAARAAAQLAQLQRGDEELRRAAAEASGEVQRLQAELDETRRSAERNARELERTREQARDTHRLREAAQTFEAELEEARRAGADAAADAAELRDKLAAIRAALSDAAG